jgi:hypothetical protein
VLLKRASALYVGGAPFRHRCEAAQRTLRSRFISQVSMNRALGADGLSHGMRAAAVAGVRRLC